MTAAAAPATPAPPRVGRSRYSAVAMSLHWAIALLLISNIGLAWYFNSLPRALQDAPTQIHKSIGITVLLLTLARIAWRFVGPPPKLPATMKSWEKAVAMISHGAFYVLMLGLPLTGWAMVSASPLIKVHPITLFGLVHWPAMAFPGLDSDHIHTVGHYSKAAHGILAKLAYVLITLHVLAALKHQFFDRDDVMARMVPFIPLRRETTP
jgi:cytochrome b561